MTDIQFQTLWMTLHLSAAALIVIVAPAAIAAHLGSSRYHLHKLLRIVDLW